MTEDERQRQVKMQAARVKNHSQRVAEVASCIRELTGARVAIVDGKVEGIHASVTILKERGDLHARRVEVCVLALADLGVRWTGQIELTRDWWWSGSDEPKKALFKAGETLWADGDSPPLLNGKFELLEGIHD